MYITLQYAWHKKIKSKNRKSDNRGVEKAYHNFSGIGGLGGGEQVFSAPILTHNIHVHIPKLVQLRNYHNARWNEPSNFLN